MSKRCPACGTDLDFWEREERKADAALNALPENIRRYYSKQFGLGIGNKEGKFVGLACKSCDHWREYGHDDDCAVAELERN